jgi:ribosomal protein L24
MMMGGKNEGDTGIVTQVFRPKNEVIVEGKTLVNP